MNSSHARCFLAQDASFLAQYALLRVLRQKKSWLLVLVFTYANIMPINSTSSNPSVNDMRRKL